jgi:mono/diheme cytochrome c family protein
LRLLKLYSVLIGVSATSAALAADAGNGRRLAEMRCAACHIVAPSQRRDVTDAAPFEVIARKFATSPETLAFALLDPHPRMNLMLTRREAQDIAAYINTLVK